MQSIAGWPRGTHTEWRLVHKQVYLAIKKWVGSKRVPYFDVDVRFVSGEINK